MKCPHNKSSKYKCLICHPQAFCKHIDVKNVKVENIVNIIISKSNKWTRGGDTLER